MYVRTGRMCVTGVDRSQNGGKMNASAQVRKAMKEKAAADNKSLIDPSSISSDGLTHSPSLGDAPPQVVSAFLYNISATMSCLHNDMC
jgi:hypothetical protein